MDKSVILLDDLWSGVADNGTTLVVDRDGEGDGNDEDNNDDDDWWVGVIIFWSFVLELHITVDLSKLVALVANIEAEAFRVPCGDNDDALTLLLLTIPEVIPEDKLCFFIVAAVIAVDIEEFLDDEDDDDNL